MNCANCGATMRLEEGKEYLVCDFCKNLHFPEANADGVRMLDEESDAICPVCKVRLVEAVAAGERILCCPRCRGILVPMETFVGVVAELRARREQPASQPLPIDPKDLEREAACPRCGRPMDTHPYAGPGNIVIDNCPRCRLNWLDHSELRRVVSAPDRQYSEAAWTLPEGEPREETGE